MRNFIIDSYEQLILLVFILYIALSTLGFGFLMASHYGSVFAGIVGLLIGFTLSFIFGIFWAGFLLMIVDMNHNLKKLVQIQSVS